MRLKKVIFALLPALLLLAVAEGAARVVWWRLEKQALALNHKRGEELFADPKLINYCMVPDEDYMYVLKRGASGPGWSVNAQGFPQPDEVPLERTPGVLRVLALGESTTMGHFGADGNYPSHLRRILATNAPEYRGVESINGGVAGWVSDQLALRSERELAAYCPDVVILYAGWNDFSVYDPYGPPPTVSWFQPNSWGLLGRRGGSVLKSVALLSALYQKYRAEHEARPVVDAGKKGKPEETYRFFLANLDRIVAAYRKAYPPAALCLCTLAGRWPQESEEEYRRLDAGRTLWMQKHDLAHEQAAEALRDFNALLRRYAAEHGLLLIDVAAAFDGLDRGRLQTDYCHMVFEGYELMAEVMYERLREAGVVRGQPSPRRAELLAKYRK